MDVRSNIAIGKCLHKLRAEASLTQSELAGRLGKPQSYVSKIEMGERSLRLHELFPYAAALGVAPTDVVTEIEASSPDVSLLSSFKKYDK